jgi:transposase
MNEETTIPRKRYDEAFKRSAIQYWRDSGKSVAQVARELGVNLSTLHQWKKSCDPEGSAATTGVRTVAELEAENRQLRREVVRLVQQRDILKKTLGILSAPPESALNGSEP